MKWSTRKALTVYLIINFMGIPLFLIFISVIGLLFTSPGDMGPLRYKGVNYGETDEWIYFLCSAIFGVLWLLIALAHYFWRKHKDSQSVSAQLVKIEKKVQKMAKKMGATQDMLPAFSGPNDDAIPYIQIDEKGHFHYIIKERGHIQSDGITASQDELLYWIMRDAVRSIGIRDIILKHKHSNRAAFIKMRNQVYRPYMIKLLSKLKRSWARKYEREDEKLKD